MPAIFEAIYNFFAEVPALSLIFLVGVTFSALTVIFIEPARKRLFRYKGYDSKKDNPWDKIMGDESGDDKKKHK